MAMSKDQYIQHQFAMQVARISWWQCYISSGAYATVPPRFGRPHWEHMTKDERLADALDTMRRHVDQAQEFVNHMEVE